MANNTGRCETAKKGFLIFYDAYDFLFKVQINPICKLLLPLMFKFTCLLVCVVG